MGLRTQCFLEMTDIASEKALQYLRSQYPYREITTSLESNSFRTLVTGMSTQMLIVLETPWYSVTVVSFMTANRARSGPNFCSWRIEPAHNQFKFPALEGNHEQLLTHKFRGALLKSCVIGGRGGFSSC